MWGVWQTPQGQDMLRARSAPGAGQVSCLSKERGLDGVGDGVGDVGPGLSVERGGGQACPGSGLGRGWGIQVCLGTLAMVQGGEGPRWAEVGVGGVSQGTSQSEEASPGCACSGGAAIVVSTAPAVSGWGFCGLRS